MITNAKSSPEEVAEALFVSHAAIKEIVSEIKEKFLLDDETNPGWKEQITAASKKTQKNDKLENRKRKRAEKKQKTSEEKNRLEWLKENKVEGSEISENESKQSAPAVIPKNKTPKLKVIPPKVKEQPPQSFSEEVNDLEELPVTKKAKFAPAISIAEGEVDDLEELSVTKKAKFTPAISITPKPVKGKLCVSTVEQSDYEPEEDLENESEIEQDLAENVVEDEKMVDPFFTTSSGEFHYFLH